jgi:cytochrome c peroxidase
VDLGRYAITEIAGDRGKFRVPTLRNVEISRPYMHDGRFNTLEEVISHYASAVKSHTNLDPIFINGGTVGIPLNTTEQRQIIAFLKTLTDHEFSKDARLAEQ